MNIPVVKKNEIPLLTTPQMVEVDRLMIEKFKISLVRMMENAGHSLALTARHLLDDDFTGKKICIACGTGNNGGGGLVAARHLSNWGASVSVILTADTTSYKPVPQEQLRILQKLPVIFLDSENNEIDSIFNKTDLIIDALIGYGINGAPKGVTANIIKGMTKSRQPVLSLDVPSGLDASTSKIYSPSVKAEATMTLALPKHGLLKDEVKEYIGKLYLADISVPPVLYKRMGIETGHIFSKSPIVEMI